MVTVPAGYGRDAIVSCLRCGASITPNHELEYAPRFDSSRRRCPECNFETWVEGDQS